MSDEVERHALLHAENLARTLKELDRLSQVVGLRRDRHPPTGVLKVDASPSAD
jgi:hypothetical protein